MPIPFIAAAILIAGAAVGQPRSKPPVPLPQPDASALRLIPGVASIAVHPASKVATHRIIHIWNWHFVNKADFVADLQCIQTKPLTESQIESRYTAFLADVESVQAEQRKLLTRLTKTVGQCVL